MVALRLSARWPARLRVAALVIPHAVAAHTAFAQEPGLAPDPAIQAENVEATIERVVQDATHPYLKWPSFPDYRDDLEQIYGPRGYGPFWLKDGVPIAAARSAISALQEAELNGLRSADYDAAVLDSLWHTLTAVPAQPGYVQGLFDTALTVGLLRYVDNLHVGRVNPRNLAFGFNIEPKKDDGPELVREAVSTGRIRDMIAEAQPRFGLYGRLKAALTTYRQLAADSGLAPVPMARTVRPGESYAGLTELRRRLVAVGDMDAADAGNGALYNDADVAAVTRFQKRHGLAQDGIIGPATFAALNVPFDQRVEQIQLAMERLRWLPPLDDTPFIAVNIPAFELWAFDSVGVGAGPTLNMRIVVGQALDKQTPVFMEDMTYLVFRPYWNVPYGITVRELLPLIRQDPGYLDTHGYEIVPRFGDDVVALPATPLNIDELGTGSLKLRQRPGPQNSLGLVKFIFPNNAGVYLHSTPAQQLFARTRRDFSHGCVRVERPVDLAAWVLKAESEPWSPGRIESVMTQERPTRVNLERPLPVVIFYTTALVELDGTVRFYDDIYEHDANLDAALDAGFPYPP